jgi:homoserine dehydrogenase
VIIRSAFSAPLVIRGAGEGARMAASGVINNLLTL